MTARRLGRCGLAVFLAVLAASVPAHAWNDEGHMAMAFLAYQQLKPVTRSRVDSLLKLNPYYSRWLSVIPQGRPEAETNLMIFMIAATWADQIKGDPEYKDDGSNGGNTPGGPESSLNIGYSDHLRHKYWHFIDTPFSQDGTALPAVPHPDIETQIAAFRLVLASGQPDALKSYDLVWLEHLIGDVHQPLHAVARVSATLPAGDAGGNLVALCNAPCRDNLHGFWDNLVGSQSRLPQSRPAAPRPDTQTEIKSALDAAKTLPAPDAALVKEMSEAAWVRESFDAARRDVYILPIANGPGPFTLTQEYLDAARRVAQQRVALAGTRLANMLNQELK
jgi:S1/P1 Nuclease